MKRDAGRGEDVGRQVGRASLALAIPMMMAAGPLVGAALGWAAQKYLGAPAWTMAAGIALGFAAGIRQTVQIIRRVSRQEREDRKEN